MEKLHTSGSNNAALLLVWSVIEIGLRNLAKKEDVPLERNTANYVIGKLASLGWIQENNIHILGAALPVRNAVAHGYKVSEDLAALVEKLLVIARTLV